MTARCRISVVIPTFKRCASVQQTLQALTRQTLPPNCYEVIVSIDGSEDGTREMIARFQAPYNLSAVWQPNQGRAAACNVGIRVAKGELLILLDDDMEPVPTFLAAHEAAHRGTSHNGVLGAVPIIIRRSSEPVVRYIGLKFNRHLEKLARPGYQFNLADFYSGNFSVRREFILRVGAFDETFKIYGNEDLELYLRLRRAGMKLVYSPEALAYQGYTKDFADLARDSIAEGYTAVLLASKHPETFDHLKLGMYREGSRGRLLVMAGLLGVGRMWTGMPDRMSFFMKWLGQRRPTWFYHLCPRVLNYFYWLGAKRALRENRRTGRGLTALTK